MVHRIFTTSVASVYPNYVNKVERKGRTKAELDQAIEWLTGFDAAALERHLAADSTFEAFFADAHLNPKASAITGVVCGVRVESIDDPQWNSAAAGGTAHPLLTGSKRFMPMKKITHPGEKIV